MGAMTEGWVGAIQNAKAKRRSVSSLAKAAGCSNTTIKKESVRLAAALDEEDFVRFCLSVPWALKVLGE